ncbi:MAG: BTAD domain-containing putative transcriptional regulator [Stackebrandtia sp.]
MDFRILGSLEVWDATDRVPIRGRLHPKILAGLALNAGRTVSLSWLVDLLWDDEPPATARRQAQNAVASLRRQLSPAGGATAGRELIERTGQGYDLNIADDELDLRRFEASASRARAMATAGERDAALDEFEAALALWRGFALHGLSGRILEAAAARLNDSHLSTFEDYADVALSTARPERVIAELHELTAAHPLRQRLTGRLMRALYQSRQAPEALRLFDTVRQRLADELGTDPGQELKDLHVRILRQDPALAPGTAGVTASGSPATAAPTGGPVPAQLPPDVSTFTGRRDQLSALDRLRDSGATAGIVSTIAGIGGVGKTALAVHWGHRAREQFPDGQLYLNLRGFDEREPLTAHDGLSRLLRSLGHPSGDIPAEVEEAASLYRSLLADKRMLVVLDNARTPAQVRPLLPASPGCLAVVTSRNRLSSLIVSHDALPVELDALAPGESLDLLVGILGPGVLSEPEQARRLCELCCQLPLALRIAAANLAMSPHTAMSDFVAELDSGARLSKLSVDDDSGTDLTVVFDRSYRVLDDDTRLLLLHLGLIPGEDFTADLAAAIADLATETVRLALAQLETAHLLQQHSPGRYRLHDLVRLFARDLAGTDLSAPRRDAAIERMLDWYGDRSKAQFPEFDNILAFCEVHTDHPRLWKVVGTLGWIANTGIVSPRSRRFAERALRTAEANADFEGQIHALDALGALSRAAGDHANAIEYRRGAASLLPHVDDRELEAKVNNSLGTSLNSHGSVREAARYQERAVAVAEANDLRAQLQVSLGNLGAIYRSMGRFSEALTCTFRAERISREAGDTFHRAIQLITVSLIYMDIGEYAKASENARRSLDMADERGAPKVSVIALQALGMIAHKAGEYRHAAEYYERSASICHKTPNLVLQIGNLHYQADLFLSTGESERAFACLSSAKQLATYRRLSSTEKAFEELIVGRAHAAAGDVDTAIEHIGRAVGLYRTEYANPLQLARALEALGDARRVHGDLDQAGACWNEALEIFGRLGVPDAAALSRRLRERSRP